MPPSNKSSVISSSITASKEEERQPESCSQLSRVKKQKSVEGGRHSMTIKLSQNSTQLPQQLGGMFRSIDSHPVTSSKIHQSNTICNEENG
jgi:hypothetical protein